MGILDDLLAGVASGQGGGIPVQRPQSNAGGPNAALLALLPIVLSMLTNRGASAGNSRDAGPAGGLGGRGRKMGDAAERARSAVTWRIRHAIKKLEPAHPALARHLGHSIKTGVFCSYTPEKETRWFV